MDPHPQLAVLIVNHNTRDLLLECIGSVLESTQAASIELVVIDNASSDGSYEALRGTFPQVTAIANPTNRGFGAACNQAILITTSPFILLLNSDARLTPQAYKALWGCMQRHSQCGGAGCRLIDPEGKELVRTRNFLTPFNQALEQLGLTNKMNSRLLRRSHLPILDSDSLDCSVDWIDGSCLILRRAALNEVGLFDEQFFMYSEDEDLCIRLKKRGWAVCFSSAGTAFHHGGASSAQNKSEMLVQFYLSQMLLLLKHRGRTSVYTFSASMKTVLMTKQLIYRFLSRASRAAESAERLAAFRRACSSLTLHPQLSRRLR